MQVESIPLNQVTDRDKDLLTTTILDNPYIPFKPYPRQYYPIIETNKALVDNEPNTALVGAGGYGGKTYLGSMLAAQFLEYPEYQALVTRKNRKELIGPDSIWNNLYEWACDRNRLGDLACERNKSELTITAPSGATIWFKYFDHEETRQKIKSESYSKIIHDEASELKPRVLKFFYRSLRNALSVRIPLAMVNLSNPGGPSTDYLCEEYVDGQFPYFPLDWRNNPYINQVLYSKTLDKLDYIDIQYQKFGNWYYRPAKGDLLPESMLRDSLIDKLPPVQIVRKLRGIDFAASKKGDRAAFVLWWGDNRNHKYMKNCTIDETGYPEDTLINLVEADNPNWNNGIFTTDYYYEKEGGSSGTMAERYIEELLEDYIEKGLFIDSVPSVSNKFTRARPMARAWKQGQISILPGDGVEDLIDELGDFGPDDKEYDYDDITDASAIGFNAFHLGGNPLTQSNKRYDLATPSAKKRYRGKKVGWRSLL
jgi:hypothetical protein